MVDDSQSTHPEMCTELKEIGESSNRGARWKQESQMNELAGATRRFWVCKNTGTEKRIKRKLLR